MGTTGRRFLARSCAHWKAHACGVAVVGFIVLALPAISQPAAADRLANRGSADDQAACTPDVFRLCMSEIPAESRIVACLIRSKRSLSPRCRAVFDRSERTPTRSARAPRSPKATRTAKPARPVLERRARRNGRQG
jgi:hypothetical protein